MVYVKCSNFTPVFSPTWDSLDWLEQRVERIDILDIFYDKNSVPWYTYVNIVPQIFWHLYSCGAKRKCTVHCMSSGMLDLNPRLHSGVLPMSHHIPVINW